METRGFAESERLSAWFAAATPHAATATAEWCAKPHLPRRLHCGVTFDVVVADRHLVGEAYRLLALYQQPLGPAVAFAGRRFAAVLVPPATQQRWSQLMATTPWPSRFPEPVCLGAGHTIRIPAPAARSAGTAVRWLEPPDEEQAIGGTPLLTGPAQLARCLTEAGNLLAPQVRTSRRGTVAAVRPDRSCIPFRGRDDEDSRTDAAHPAL
ncbi:hypothetical protein GCM10010129_01530 [Streptomyces fumigatiscleroticus]|nr:hypothetical protein GCM10010129_01530 [Streptomyces fumigatiscleroticus]